MYTSLHAFSETDDSEHLQYSTLISYIENYQIARLSWNIFLDKNQKTFLLNFAFKILDNLR